MRLTPSAKTAFATRFAVEELGVNRWRSAARWIAHFGLSGRLPALGHLPSPTGIRKTFRENGSDCLSERPSRPILQTKGPLPMVQ